ncbi:MAG: signal peptidase II [Actinomycetota bacterium]
MLQGVGEQAVSTKRTKVAIFVIAAVVVLLDQATKAWALAALGDGSRIPVIGRTIDFRLVRNPGSAFGLFADATLWIFLASLAVTAGVAVWALRDPQAPPVLGLVLGGGVGNLIDRLVQPPGGGSGHVVDFIYLSFWPTFNLADAAIVTGVGLLFYLAFREGRS